MKYFESKTTYAVITMCVIGAVAQLKFRQVPDNTPMIINKMAKAQLTYESYRLVYYADLGPFFGIRENIKLAIDSIQRTHTSLNKPGYISSAGQLQHQLQLLYADEDRLMAHRAKRFIVCETCGKVNHFLFGVLDQRDAQRYDDAINNLANATLNDKELIKNQSMVFEAAMHFNKNVFLRYEHEINNLNEKMENQTIEMRQMQLEVTEQSLIQITQLLFSEYYRIYGQIRRTLSDARNGKINELIPKEQLSRDMEHLSRLLLSHQKLPIDFDHEDIFHIFKFSTLRSTLFARKIMVEVNIPIAENEQYYLFKATPIPIRIELVNMVVSVNSNYFLLNWDNTKYIPMSRSQMDNGRMLASGEMLYSPTVTTMLNSEEICEWQILLKGPKIQTACHLTPFLERNVIITVKENEMLFVELAEETLVYETCNGTQFDQKNIHGRGLINLDPNCLFKTENFLIRPHKNSGMNATQIILPTVQFNEHMLTRWDGQAMGKFGKATIFGKKLNIIQNSNEFQRILDTTRDLTENAKKEWKFEKMQGESNSISILSGVISAFSIFATILTIASIFFYKFNLFGCILRAIIKRSTATQIESDGTLTLELPNRLAPKSKRNQTLKLAPITSWAWAQSKKQIQTI